MSILLEIGRSLGLVGVAGMLAILGLLSARLGAVLKMSPAHRVAPIGAGLVTVAGLANLFHAAAVIQPASAPAWLGLDIIETLFVALPLCAGLLAGAWVGWRYWRWLLIKP